MSLTLDHIIEGCRKGEPIAQRELYERYAGVMYAICCRYVKDRTMAQDLLHDGFITVFTKIAEFRSEGSFEGWCKRIFVNTALGFLRKNNPLAQSQDVDALAWVSSDEESAVEKLSAQELQAFIDQLPDGYKTILNLYAVEGYSHKEVGEMLGISENTSRSQYSRARAKLIEVLKDNEITMTSL